MIHLLEAAKIYQTPDSQPKMILQPTTLSVPADRRLAVLGKRQQGKSVFMRILAGAEAPSHGQILARARLSPIIRPGALFHPKLSIAENLQYYARTLNLHPDRLMQEIEIYTGHHGSRESDKGEQRKAMEVALITLQGFDCYMVDELASLAEHVRDRHFAALTKQGAGIIFATNTSNLARQYADCAVVIRNGIVHPFSSVEEAVTFHER